MKITFVLPHIRLAGGVKVVFEYANRLQEKGHDISVIYPIFPGTKWYNVRKLVGTILGAIRNLERGNQVGWFDLKVNLIRVPTLSERYIPDADIIIATWWETAYYVNRYRSNKGKKLYLIQHYEVWGGPKEKVDRTYYELGLYNVVISSWLKNILENLGAKVEAVILNGVNLKEFYPEYIERNDNKIRLLMPYRREKWKGVKDGLRVFEIIKKKRSDVKLIMFGQKPKEGELPSEVEFHLNPTNDELRKIYNSCDIFVFPSHCEGFGLPPMEAMACKIPVITTNVGAVPDITISRKTALISQSGDIEDLSRNVMELIEDEQKRNIISDAGYQYIQEFTWDKAVDQFENILEKISNEGIHMVDKKGLNSAYQLKWLNSRI